MFFQKALFSLVRLLHGYIDAGTRGPPFEISRIIFTHVPRMGDVLRTYSLLLAKRIFSSHKLFVSNVWVAEALGITRGNKTQMRFAQMLHVGSLQIPKAIGAVEE